MAQEETKQVTKERRLEKQKELTLLDLLNYAVGSIKTDTEFCTYY